MLRCLDREELCQAGDYSQMNRFEVVWDNNKVSGSPIGLSA